VQAPLIRIDPRTLRDEAVDVAAAERWVDHLQGLGPRGDDERVSWLRILGRLDAAEQLGWSRLASAGGPADEEQLGLPLPRSAVLPAVRLAAVLHWSGRTDSARRLFDDALTAAVIRDDDDGQRVRSTLIRCFVLQHRGKLLLDSGDPVGALASFDEVLTLRLGAGAPEDQVESARIARAEAERRIAADTHR